MNITQEGEERLSSTTPKEFDNSINSKYQSNSTIPNNTLSIEFHNGFKPYVGAFRITPIVDKINTIDFCYHTKPSWFHRKMTKFFLGWTWVDY